MPSHTHTRFAPTDPRPSGQAPVLKVKTYLKAGLSGGDWQHNETLVQTPRPGVGLRVKTHLKAGLRGGDWQHNETLVRDTPRQRTRAFASAGRERRR
jgi:hypothetical protein